MMTVYVGPERYPFYLHKGRLCQHSTFHRSIQHGSVYLEEYGVDEFKLFEEWLYSERINYPTDSDDPSLLLVKLFCLAEDFEISNLQNATLDLIRDRATEQYVSVKTPITDHQIYTNQQGLFGSAQRPLFGLQRYQTTTTSPGFEEPVVNYLPPATASAVHYAYQKTSVGSPLRRLLTDIFAYDVRPEALYEENSLSFPARFMADVLFVTKKRLPLRLNGEEADFDKNADKYYVHDSLSTRNDWERRTSEDVEVRGTNSDFNSHEELAAKVATPKPADSEPESMIESVAMLADSEHEQVIESVAIDEGDKWGSGRPIRSSKKAKKRGKQTTWQ